MRKKQKKDLPTDCHICYVQVYHKCGVSTCPTCQNGRGHGPYCEAIWYKDGQKHRVYIGTTLPDVTRVYPETWNAQLILARKGRRWTTEHVADLVGVKPETYRNWEKRRNVPRAYALRKLCSVFGLSAAELGFGDRDNDDKR